MLENCYFWGWFEWVSVFLFLCFVLNIGVSFDGVKEVKWSSKWVFFVEEYKWISWWLLIEVFF